MLRSLEESKLSFQSGYTVNTMKLIYVCGKQKPIKLLQDHAEGCIELCPVGLEVELYCISGRKQKITLRHQESFDNLIKSHGSVLQK